MSVRAKVACGNRFPALVSFDTNVSPCKENPLILKSTPIDSKYFFIRYGIDTPMPTLFHALGPSSGINGSSSKPGCPD
jgi:hypothetical protein